MSTTGPELIDADLLDQIHDLVRRYRATCLWFMDREYLPADRPQALSALRHIERHGDRQAFVLARRLREWLSRNSSEASVG